MEDRQQELGKGDTMRHPTNRIELPKFAPTSLARSSASMSDAPGKDDVADFEGLEFTERQRMIAGILALICFAALIALVVVEH